MVNDILKEAEDRMKSARSVLAEDLGGIRTGRASPTLVERLLINYYDLPTPLIQLASISVPEPRSLMIKPFDKTSLANIEKAILASELGLTPTNDGQNIHLNLPILTEERRRDLVHVVNKRVEEAKIAVRNVRRDAIRDLRDFEKEKLISEDDLTHGEAEIQKVTDRYIEQLDEASAQKQKEIMEI